MTREELEQLAKDAQTARQQSPRSVNVCLASGYLTLHSEAVKSAFESEVKRTGTNCRVRGVGCMGLCSLGPLVTSEPGDVLYKNVSPSDAQEIVATQENAPISRLLCPRDQPFFRHQVNIVLENSGRIDPDKIDEYIAVGGYQALLHALAPPAPQPSALQSRSPARFPRHHRRPILRLFLLPLPTSPARHPRSPLPNPLHPRRRHLSAQRHSRPLRRLAM